MALYGLLVNTHLWQIGHDRSIDLDEPCIVAILNITPDSFADGGKLDSPDTAAEHAEQSVRQGALVLDIGGESTRPGAERICAQEQIRRVVPVIERIRSRVPEIAISIDTTIAEVARRAIQAGANIINDVSAGEEDESMLSLAAETGSGLVLMHRLRPPNKDSYSDEYSTGPAYKDAVDEVRAYLAARFEAAMHTGVRRESIVLDPGLGFGKDVEQNMELIRRTTELCELGAPVMSAASRKSFVGRVSLGRESDPSERLAGSIAVTVLHALSGARLFRVHDPGQHAQALRILASINR